MGCWRPPVLRTLTRFSRRGFWTVLHQTMWIYMQRSKSFKLLALQTRSVLEEWDGMTVFLSRSVVLAVSSMQTVPQIGGASSASHCVSPFHVANRSARRPAVWVRSVSSANDGPFNGTPEPTQRGKATPKGHVQIPFTEDTLHCYQSVVSHEFTS